MNKAIIAKICGVLCILGAIIFVGWTFIDVYFVITSGLVKEAVLEANLNKRTLGLGLALISMTVYFLIMFLGFAGYFFSGAFGKKLAGKILFGIVFIITGLNVIVTVIIIIFVSIQTGNLKGGGIYAIVYFSTFSILHLMLLVFGITSFVVGKAKLLKSIIPFIVLGLCFIVPIVIGAISMLSISLLGKENNPIYALAQNATIPHWIAFGSISWALMGFAPFIKNKETVDDSN